MYVCIYIQFLTSIFPHFSKLFPVVEKSVQVQHVYVVRGLVCLSYYSISAKKKCESYCKVPVEVEFRHWETTALDM